MAVLTSPCRPVSVWEEPNPQPPSAAGRLRLAFRAAKDGILNSHGWTPDRLKMNADKNSFFTAPAVISMPRDVVVTHQHSKRIHHPYVQQLPPEDRVREHCRPGQHLLRTKG